MLGDECVYRSQRDACFVARQQRRHRRNACARCIRQTLGYCELAFEHRYDFRCRGRRKTAFRPTCIDDRQPQAALPAIQCLRRQCSQHPKHRPAAVLRQQLLYEQSRVRLCSGWLDTVIFGLWLVFRRRDSRRCDRLLQLPAYTLLQRRRQGLCSVDGLQ